MAIFIVKGINDSIITALIALSSINQFSVVFECVSNESKNQISEIFKINQKIYQLLTYIF